MKAALLALAGSMITASLAPAQDADGVVSRFAGEYRESFSNASVDGSRFRSENLLQIARVDGKTAFVRAELSFFNGHQCSISGMARVERDRLVYRSRFIGGPEKCVLTLRRAGRKIILGDANGACRADVCGARGGLDGADFNVASRRPLGAAALARIRRSESFARAEAERAGRPDPTP